MKPRLQLHFVLFAAAMAVAQNTSDFRSVRLQRIQPASGLIGTQTDCISVFPDGKFHREQLYRDTRDLWVKIYEGRLSQSQLTSLGEILNSAEFRSIDVGGAEGILHGIEEEYFKIEVARAAGVEEFEFDSKTSRHQYQQTLDPLLAWWKSVEKEKAVEQKNGTPSGCAVPPVVGTAPMSENTGPFQSLQITSMRLSPYVVQAQCALLFPDGSFHREWEAHGARGASLSGKTWGVQEGHLSSEDVAGLIEAIDTPDFRALNPGPPASGLSAANVLRITIFRPGGKQYLEIKNSTAADAGPTLSPLVAWLSRFSKRPFSETPHAKRTGCRPSAVPRETTR